MGARTIKNFFNNDDGTESEEPNKSMHFIICEKLDEEANLIHLGIFDGTKLLFTKYKEIMQALDNGVKLKGFNLPLDKFIQNEETSTIYRRRIELALESDKIVGDIEINMMSILNRVNDFVKETNDYFTIRKTNVNKQKGIIKDKYGDVGTALKQGGIE